jgi:hypothetical protein
MLIALRLRRNCSRRMDREAVKMLRILRGLPGGRGLAYGGQLHLVYSSKLTHISMVEMNA